MCSFMTNFFTEHNFFEFIYVIVDQGVVTYVRYSFYSWIIFHYMVYDIFQIHLSADRPLGCFYFLTIIMLILTFMCEVFLWTYIFVSLGYIRRSGIAGWCGKFIFNTLRNCQTVFQSGCTILHFLQQCTRVPISLCPHWHSSFWFIAILVGVKWYFIWCCLAFPWWLMMLKTFLCAYLAICRSPLDKCLLKSLAHLKLGCLIIDIWVLYIFWMQVSYQIHDSQMFSPSLDLYVIFSWWCTLKHKNFEFWWNSI